MFLYNDCVKFMRIEKPRFAKCKAGIIFYEQKFNLKVLAVEHNLLDTLSIFLKDI